MNLIEFLEKLAEANKEVISTSIDTPLGEYTIQTGPEIIYGGYVTVAGVINKQGKLFGPIGIGRYSSQESAIEGHDNWKNRIQDNPPTMLVDVLTNEVEIIT